MADHQSLSSHRVRSLAQVAGLEPTAGLQYGLCVTRNGSISIADYFTMTSDSGEVSYRRSCHYAYHPADDAMLSWHELLGNPGQSQRTHEILDEADILDGIDELGVLLYGHARNAYWYGSRLSVEETRKLAPYQNATGLQVTSARLAAAWSGRGTPTPESSRPTRSTSPVVCRCRGLTWAPSKATSPPGRR